MLAPKSSSGRPTRQGGESSGSDVPRVDAQSTHGSDKKTTAADGSSNAPQIPPGEQTLEPDDQLDDAARQLRIDHQYARKLFAKVVQQLDGSRVYSSSNQSSQRETDSSNVDNERRQAVLNKLASLAESSAPTAGDDAKTTPQVVVDRLRATAQLLKDPKVYNTDAGRSMLHFFYQSLGDPLLGADDPHLSSIVDLLSAGTEATVRTCFQERKEHQLGYVPPKKIRSDVTPDWVIEVPQ